MFNPPHEEAALTFPDYHAVDSAGVGRRLSHTLSSFCLLQKKKKVTHLPFQIKKKETESERELETESEREFDIIV